MYDEAHFQGTWPLNHPEHLFLPVRQGLTSSTGSEAAKVRCRGRAFRNGKVISQDKYRVSQDTGSRQNCAQIGQVKEKISSEKGWEASQQKLIYSGMHQK